MLSAKELWVNYNRLCDTYDNCVNCPACLDHENNDILCDDMDRVDEFIEVVEKWSKDNPVITNRMKFKEVFGYEITVGSCPLYNHNECSILINGSIHAHKCSSCPWWDEEYKEVK